MIDLRQNPRRGNRVLCRSKEGANGPYLCLHADERVAGAGRFAWRVPGRCHQALWSRSVDPPGGNRERPSST
jgi:hypothetical protein